MRILIATILLLAASAAVAQQGDFAAHANEVHPQPLSTQESIDNPTKTLEQVARSMGRYSKDISEIPLKVESTVYTFDKSGNEKHRKSSSHSMKFVKRSYAEGKIMRRLKAHKKGLHWVSADEMNGDRATALLALIFDNGKASSNNYDLVFHTKSKRLKVNIVNNSPCEGFDPSVMNDNLRFCGQTHLLLDGTTMDPLEGSFEAGGFPKVFGKVRYLSFKFTEEFQKVAVEGSKEPFLLPAKVVVTYESDRERKVIGSKFSVESKTISPAD